MNKKAVFVFGIILFVLISLVSFTSSNNEDIKKIAFWYGKVNQHYDEINGWQTDPDGVAGAGTFAQFGNEGWFDRKLEYCQRFWPNTIDVVESGEEHITDFKSKYNQGSFSSIKRTYVCFQSNLTNNTGGCVDSDGLDYFLKGNVTIGGSFVHFDFCSGIVLKEGTCANESLFVLNKSCIDFGSDYFCENGACISNNSNQTHRVCSGADCLVVSGPGVDECTSTLQCIGGDSVSTSSEEKTKMIWGGVMANEEKTSVTWKELITLGEKTFEKEEVNFEGQETFWKKAGDFFRNIF